MKIIACLDFACLFNIYCSIYLHMFDTGDFLVLVFQLKMSKQKLSQ